MANSFTQLQTDVDTVARRSVDTITYQLLTDELNARLRLTLMESTSTITVNAESEALPADFLEARAMYISVNGGRHPIEIVSEFTQSNEYRSSGVPKQAVFTKGNVLFNPAPDGEYSVELRYIASLAALSGGSDTNDVMDTHYPIYLYGALKHFGAIIRDENAVNWWERMFEQAIENAERADKNRRYGGGPLVMQAGAVG